MEMVDIVATANFVSNRIGSITRKQRLRVAKPIADEFVRLGVAKINPSQQVRQQIPLLTATLAGGGAEPLPLLPADPASPKKTAVLLQARTGSTSSSTTLGAVHLSPTPSMPATKPGGMSTTKRSKKDSKANSGRKIYEPLSAMEFIE